MAKESKGETVMATRKQTEVEESIETTETLQETFPVIDDDPEDFIADAPSVSHSNGDASGYAISSLDELNQFTVDSQLKEQEHARLNPPRGDWEKDQSWSIDLKRDIYVRTGDCRQGDINPAGRTSVTVRGHCKPRTDENNYSHDPEFMLTVSYDYREVERDGKAGEDQRTRLYQEARDAYLAIHGKQMDSKPSTLIEFLLKDTYVIQAFKADNGMMVNKIKARRSRGSR